LSVKTVVCLGASLTAGTVSFNYLDFLSARFALADFRFINRGVNGDLAWNGLQRLDRVIADRPDFVSILIGTNDVNATLSERNFAWYKTYKQITQQPTLESYEKDLRQIISRLKNETNARLSLLSLAVIGEDLAHEANRQVAQYNEAIHRIAVEENIAYLPLYERMTSYLRDHEAERAHLPPRLAYRDGLHNIGNATALHDSGYSWDEIARRNGLLVTTDTLHLNSIGAGMVADLIEGWLIAKDQL
jgi:lysophospholipase L1-like esterase